VQIHILKLRESDEIAPEKNFCHWIPFEICAFVVFHPFGTKIVQFYRMLNECQVPEGRDKKRKKKSSN
jgi:hypothetical protein